MIYVYLFWVFFKIGLFGFGGGMAMISLIRMEVVDHYAWLTASQFADLLAISQVTPGPISVNTATFIGYTQAGIVGSLVATAALVLPNLILMVIVLKYYLAHRDSKYMRSVMSILLPVVAGLILAAALMMCKDGIFTNVTTVGIFVVVLVLNLFTKVNPILLIVMSAVVGYLINNSLPVAI